MKRRTGLRHGPAGRRRSMHARPHPHSTSGSDIGPPTALNRYAGTRAMLPNRAGDRHHEKRSRTGGGAVTSPLEILSLNPMSREEGMCGDGS